MPIYWQKKAVATDGNSHVRHMFCSQSMLIFNDVCRSHGGCDLRLRSALCCAQCAPDSTPWARSPARPIGRKRKPDGRPPKIRLAATNTHS